MAPTGRPDDVVETHENGMTVWTKATRSGPIRVSFHPSADPVVRARQEADLAMHLAARLKQRRAKR